MLPAAPEPLTPQQEIVQLKAEWCDVRRLADRAADRMQVLEVAIVQREQALTQPVEPKPE